jgi:hypothetical protein
VQQASIEQKIQLAMTTDSQRSDWALEQLELNFNRGSFKKIVSRGDLVGLHSAIAQ